jgi:hypothetical protein
MFALTQLAIADFEEHESSENALAVAEQFEARLVTADQTFNPNVVIGLSERCTGSNVRAPTELVNRDQP